MSKIPCLVLAYYDYESNRATIDCLLTQSADLDLIVLENRSPFTDDFTKPYVLDLVASGKVSKYFLFERNISNNTFEVVLDAGQVDLSHSEYVMLTDGDLVTADESWLAEDLEILERCEEVFACGIRLDLSNLPTETFPEARTWVRETASVSDLYVEQTMGTWFLLMRTAEFLEFLRYRRRHNLRLIDISLRRFSREVLGKKIVATMRSQARHLAWDRYHDLDHPYTRLKTERSFSQIWFHNAYSAYEVYTADGVRRHVPVAKVLRGYVQDCQDWPRQSAGWLASAVRGAIRAKVTPSGHVR